MEPVISEPTQWSGSLTRLASDLGQVLQKYHRMVHKCPLYGTQLDGLQHSPPRMKNQHGLNEGKNHLGKKNLSIECL
jgi:hypothetical protein